MSILELLGTIHQQLKISSKKSMHIGTPKYIFAEDSDLIYQINKTIKKSVNYEYGLTYMTVIKLNMVTCGRIMHRKPRLYIT
jgi:hypothetical protein